MQLTVVIDKFTLMVSLGTPFTRCKDNQDTGLVE